MQNNHPLPDAVSLRATSDIEKNVAELKGLADEETMFASQAQFILLQIADIYGKCNPTASGDDYLHDLFIPACASNLDPYEVLRGALPIPKEATIYRLLMASLLLCNRANNLYSKVNSDDGWATLLEASYWCGCASLGDKFSDLSEIAAMAVKREDELARIIGCNKKTDRKVEEVARLLKELVPANGWETYTCAAQEIQNHIINNKSESFPTLSQKERGSRTITGHIEEAIKRNPLLGQHMRKKKKSGPPKK